MILDMGEPVRIIDVARRMIEMSGKDVEIMFTGLRHGEKLHEDLFSVDEQVESPRHPRISHAPVGPVEPSNLVFESWLVAAGDKSDLDHSGKDDALGRRPLSSRDEVLKNG